LENTSPSLFANLGEERPFQNLHVVVPRLTSGTTDSSQWLTWKFGVEDRLVNVEWILDDFVLLATDNPGDADVRRFAQCCGPLTGRPVLEGCTQGSTSITESTIVWRSLARALSSFLAVATAVASDREPEDPSDWFRVLDAPKIAMALASGDQDAESFELEHVRHVYSALKDEAPRTFASPVIRLREAVNAFLSAAGVQADVGIGSPRREGPFLAIPAGDHGVVPHSNLPIADGLMCLFAVQTAHAIRDNRIRKCDWCERYIPLAQLARSPRRDIPFYGNHKECRRAAILKSKRESQRRRYYRLRQSDPPVVTTAKDAGTVVEAMAEEPEGATG
jgi:hypothetical protein